MHGFLGSTPLKLSLSARSTEHSCAMISRKCAMPLVWLTDADLIFRNQAKRRFAGERFDQVHRAPKAGRLSLN
jgi:hypothetical protein